MPSTFSTLFSNTQARCSSTLLAWPLSVSMGLCFPSSPVLNAHSRVSFPLTGRGFLKRASRAFKVHLARTKSYDHIQTSVSPKSISCRESLIPLEKLGKQMTTQSTTMYHHHWCPQTSEGGGTATDTVLPCRGVLGRRAIDPTDLSRHRNVCQFALGGGWRRLGEHAHRARDELLLQSFIRHQRLIDETAYTVPT